MGATYVLLHDTPDEQGHNEATLKFFEWALDHGAETVNALDYVSLPEQVVTRIRSQWPANAGENMASKRLAGQ
ncbi:hypothetical protein [Paraburkholderia terrae]